MRIGRAASLAVSAGQSRIRANSGSAFYTGCFEDERTQGSEVADKPETFASLEDPAA